MVATSGNPQHADAELRAILESRVAGIVKVDAEARFVMANDRFCEMVGRRRDQLLAGATLFDVTHEADRPETARRFATLRDGADHVAIEQRYVRTDGASIWAFNGVTAIREADGVFEGAIAIIADITRYKRVQEALAHSELRHRSLFDRNYDAVFSFDLQGSFTSLNDKVEEITGYERDELLGTSFEQLVVPEVLDDTLGAFLRVVQGDQQMLDTKIRHKDGHIIEVNVTGVPIVIQDGSVEGVYGIARDVTDVRRAEAALRESEQRYRSIFESAGAGLWEEDFTAAKEALDEIVRSHRTAPLREYLAMNPGELDRLVSLVRIIDVNEEAVRLAEADSKEHLLGSLDAIALPETRSVFIEEFVALHEGHSFVQGEAALKTLKGNRIDVLFTLSLPPLAPGLDHVIVSWVDISERKRAEQALQRALDAKNEFLGLVSHELRTPITTVYGGARLLRRRWDLLDEETRNQLSLDVESGADRIRRMVEDLLVLSRLELGHGVAGEPVLLQRALPGLLEGWQERYPGRRLKLRLEQDVPPVSAEVAYLERVLFNLLTNADKYSPQEEVIEVRVKRLDQDFVTISIVDRGKGVPDHELEKIFEPFYRTEEAAAVASGVGVGLSVCKRLIELQGGRIWAQGEQDGGMNISFTLPVEVE
jgi:PAS domain S-box-containing protein